MRDAGNALSWKVVEDSSALPCVGDRIGDRYVLTARIGHGAMAHIYRARHERIGHDVALKVLDPRLAEDPDRSERFAREARILAQVQAEHVVAVLDVDVLPNGLPYLVLEYLEGHDLEREIALHGSGRLPVKDACDYVHQAALGMIHAHEAGIVHRDLKPSNLFLCEPGGGGASQGRRVVKVVDFGVSRIANDETRSTAANVTLGTPLYMSPEQVRSTAAIDERSDIWSLGVILYELLTGTTPFTGPTPAAVLASVVADTFKPPRSLRPELDSELAAVVMRALEKDPGCRFPTMRAFAAALAPFAVPDKSERARPVAPNRRQSVLALETAPTQAEENPRTRRPWVLALGVAAAAAFALTVMANVVREAPATPQRMAAKAAALAPPAELAAAIPMPSAVASAPAPTGLDAVSANAATENRPARVAAPRAAAPLSGARSWANTGTSSTSPRSTSTHRPDVDPLAP